MSDDLFDEAEHESGGDGGRNKVGQRGRREAPEFDAPPPPRALGALDAATHARATRPAPRGRSEPNPPQLPHLPLAPGELPALTHVASEALPPLAADGRLDPALAAALTGSLAASPREHGDGDGDDPTGPRRGPDFFFSPCAASPPPPPDDESDARHD